MNGNLSDEELRLLYEQYRKKDFSYETYLKEKSIAIKEELSKFDPDTLSVEEVIEIIDSHPGLEGISGMSEIKELKLKRINKQFLEKVIITMFSEFEQHEYKVGRAMIALREYLPEKSDLFVPLLNHSDERVRHGSCYELWAMRCRNLSNSAKEMALQSFMRSAKDEESEYFRYFATCNLGYVGEQTTIPLLEWLQENDTELVDNWGSVDEAASESIQKINERLAS